MAHPNEELPRTFFTTAESGDLATLDGLFADNVSAHIAGNHALAGSSSSGSTITTSRR